MKKSPKIAYLLSYPHSLMHGGGVEYIEKVIDNISKIFPTKELSFINRDLDWDVLLVFGFTFVNPEILEMAKKLNKKVILFPIFDRTKPIWLLNVMSIFEKLPVLNSYQIRNRLLQAADEVVVLNDTESREISAIYRHKNNFHTNHLGIKDSIIELDKTISKDLFYKQYGFTDFVFCPAATISNRKNQLTLIKALRGTDLKLVINGTNFIQDNLEDELNELTKENKNILLLGSLDIEMLVSCYKNARVSVSVSKAETAGIVNLEAAYLGCNIVASNIAAFREYLGSYADFVDNTNESEIRESVLLAYNKQPDPTIKQYILDNYSWKTNTKNLVKLI